VPVPPVGIRGGGRTRAGAHAPDVEDPYYGVHADFEDVFAVIDAALPGLHAWVDERLTGPGRAG
jgi:protein-tyrosine phosphatase